MEMRWRKDVNARRTSSKGRVEASGHKGIAATPRVKYYRKANTAMARKFRIVEKRLLNQMALPLTENNP
jgi:hypothetical protein